VPLGARTHARMAPMHIHHACACTRPPGAHRFNAPRIVRPRRGRGRGAVLEPRQSDVRTPIHTLARARPRSPQAVLASTQPIIASYNDARCGCDTAGRLRCLGSGAKWARAISAAGVRCAQEHVASPPRPAGILPGPMPDFYAARGGGASLQGPSSHVATMLLGGGSRMLVAARR
jgi:hypothetical protein